jgi:predicted glycosyltransferase
MRFLLYSHDGLGLGHTRRHLAVASALSEICPQASILLVTGADDVYRMGLSPHVEILKLPALRKVAQDQYSSRRLQIPTDEIRSLRSELLHTAVKSFRPDVVLVDKHPFGAKGEFRAGLEELKRFGGKAALGLRDILDEPRAVAEEWGRHRMLQKVGDFYDLVMIYGTRSVFDPIVQYGFPKQVAGRTRFCGYVVQRLRAHGSSREMEPFFVRARSNKPVVLATAGGGEDGFYLLHQFLEASKKAPWQAMAVTGPMAEEAEIEVLQREAQDAKAALFRFIPHLSYYFNSVDALVCMGGYNTLVEAVSSGTPTVCVPRTSPRKEQLIRASAFGSMDLLRCVPPEVLNASALRKAINLALKSKRKQMVLRANQHLEFHGAYEAARHLLALAGQNLDCHCGAEHVSLAAE